MADDETAAIVAQGLTKRYGGAAVVDDVSLTVRPGEFYGFLGPNGAGKSTTIRMLAGALRPTVGSVTVAGCDPAREPLEMKRRIGVVTEETALYERLSATEFLEFVGRMHGLSAGDVRRRVADLLDLLDLAPAANTWIADYSLGMRRKTAVAAALIHRPRVLFLDEPFNGVDTLSVRVLEGILRHLARERGVAIFFTSHALDAVERLCDRVAILSRGRIIAEGSPAELCARACLSGGAGAAATLEDAFARLVGEAREAEQIPSWL